MDLSSLYSTLPPEQLQQAEKEMMDKFRQAALSITHLYKASMHTSKQAYSAGYSACLSDILQTVQASLSASSLQSPSSSSFDASSSITGPIANGTDDASSSRSQGLGQSHTSAEATASAAAARTLGRLMDWVEARQEALRIEAEEEERERERERDVTGAFNGGGEGVQRGESSKAGQGRASGRPAGPLRSRSRSTQPASVRFNEPAGMKMDQDDDQDQDQEDPMSSSIASLAAPDRLTLPTSGPDIMISPSLSAPTPTPTPQYRQRDALVQAVQRATAARSQSPKGVSATMTAGENSGGEGSSSTSTIQPRRAMMEVPSSPPSMTASTPQQSHGFASSPNTFPTPTPAQAFRPTATATIPTPHATPINALHPSSVRPVKPLQYHRSKSGTSHARKDKDQHQHHHLPLRSAAAMIPEQALEDENGLPIFAPFLPGAMPMFPGFSSAGTTTAPSTETHSQDYPVGSKRPHDSGVIGGIGAAPLERTGNGRSGGGRKRGHGAGKGHQGGGGWDVDMEGANGGDGGDERDRKRIARR